MWCKRDNTLGTSQKWIKSHHITKIQVDFLDKVNVHQAGSVAKERTALVPSAPDQFSSIFLQGKKLSTFKPLCSLLNALLSYSVCIQISDFKEQEV